MIAAHWYKIFLDDLKDLLLSYTGDFHTIGRRTEPCVIIVTKCIINILFYYLNCKKYFNTYRHH